MSFLSPFPLLLAGAVALAMVALHLLATRRPPSTVLPTARFVPLTEARAVSRTSRPTDLLLLALRVLAVLLIGAAFARPVVDAAGPAVRTLVMLDVSRAVADPAAARALARGEIGEGGALVVFDSVAREASVDSLDATPETTRSTSLDAPETTQSTSLDPTAARARAAVGSLSPAFVAARRAAARIARGADSVRLVLISPLVEGSIDAATESLRAGWPGRVDIIRVAATPDTARGEPATLVTTLDDDPLAPAIAAVGGLRGGHRVRIMRQGGGDSTEADVVLLWPATFDDSIVPAGVTAFGAAGSPPVTVVAPLARLPLDTAVAGSRVIARWNDGAPAVEQAPLGAGAPAVVRAPLGAGAPTVGQSPPSTRCVRHVGIGVPLAGDLTLRAPFTRLLETLLAPCDGAVGAPLDDDAIAWLAGSTNGLSAERADTQSPAAAIVAPLASAADLVAESSGDRSRWPLVLLALATLLLVVELAVRRRSPA